MHLLRGSCVCIYKHAEDAIAAIAATAAIAALYATALRTMKSMCSFFTAASLLLLLLLLTLVSANNCSTGTSPLIFTYLSFANNTVTTAITVYGGASPTTKPTGYHVNSAHLAYPTFSNVTGTLANDAPAPGLLNATALAGAAFELILQSKNATAANCQTCKKSSLLWRRG